MQLIGHGAVRDHPTSWLLPPPTPLPEPETINVTSSAPVDWRGRRRRLASARRSANDDVEAADRRTTHVDVLPTSKSEAPMPTVPGCPTRLSPDVEERQPFPVYPPMLGRIFPSMSSSSTTSLLSSSLAYEMLATAALSSLRHASLLPPSSASSYDVISAAAAAALLQHPHSHHQLAPFVAPLPATFSSLGQPDVERVSAGSVLDLVVAPTRSESTAAGDERDAADLTTKHSPVCRPDSDADQLSARARCCVWRPY